MDRGMSIANRRSVDPQWAIANPSIGTRQSALGSGWSALLEEVERVDVVVARIDRGDDAFERAGGWIALRLPQIALERQIQPRAVGVEQHAHARPMRIRRMDAQHDGDLVRAE